jgi:hypothetical protein
MYGPSTDGGMWSGAAEDILGCRIAVLWGGDKWFEGVVAETQDGQHFVAYDDGDRRWYRLADKTFRVVAVPPAAAAAAAATNAGE